MKKCYALCVALLTGALSTSAAIPVTAGFDVVEDLWVGSQNYSNKSSEETPDVYALISLKDFKTYPFDAVYGTAESNIDMKFYIMGGTSNATTRLYSIDGASATVTKNNEYKGSTAGITLDNFAVKNATRFKLLSGIDFDATTVEDLKKIDPATISANTINPVSAGNVIAFKTALTSDAGAARLGLILIKEIRKVSETSSEGVIQISIKMIKDESENTVTDGFRYLKEVRVGTSAFANGTQAGYEDIFSLFSIKDMRCYPIEEAKASLNNVDIKFHLQGAASEPRIYSMNNQDSKNTVYKDPSGATLQSLLMQNEDLINNTSFLKLPASFDFESATATEVNALTSEIKAGYVKPAAVGDVIAYKGAASSLAAGVVGIFKIKDIILPVPANKELGYFVLTFKQLSTTTAINTVIEQKTWTIRNRTFLSSEGGMLNIVDASGRRLIQKRVEADSSVDLSDLNGFCIIEFGGKAAKVIL